MASTSKTPATSTSFEDKSLAVGLQKVALRFYYKNLFAPSKLFSDQVPGAADKPYYFSETLAQFSTDDGIKRYDPSNIFKGDYDSSSEKISPEMADDSCPFGAIGEPVPQDKFLFIEKAKGFKGLPDENCVSAFDRIVSERLQEFKANRNCSPEELLNVISYDLLDEEEENDN